MRMWHHDFSDCGCKCIPGASLTDDNAVMAEIAGAVCTVISAMLY